MMKLQGDREQERCLASGVHMNGLSMCEMRYVSKNDSLSNFTSTSSKNLPSISLGSTGKNL